MHFEYFKDSKSLKPKGHVDMVHCDRIVDEVPVGERFHIFSIRTKHANRMRTYYFSAINSADKAKWLHCLVRATGFVDTDPMPPISASTLSVRSHGFPHTRGQMPSFTQFNTIAGTRHPPQSTRFVTMGPTPWPEEGYTDPGTEYVMGGPEEDLDDYYRLPELPHSYVNLTNSEEPPSDNRLRGEKLTPGTIAEVPPAIPNRLLNTDAITSINDPSERETQQAHHNSSDSLYLHVWEAGDDIETDPVESVPPIPEKKAIDRTARRRQCASEYHQVPLELPPPPPSTTTAVKVDPVDTLAPIPVRQPAPSLVPRTVAQMRLAAQTLPAPTSVSNPFHTHNCASFLPEDSPIETDLPLPMRAACSSNTADMSSAASNDGSSESLSDSQMERGMGAQRSTITTDVTATIVSRPQRPPAPERQHTARVPTPTEARTRATIELADTLHRPSIQLLNYIEPCNLDLSSKSETNHSAQPLSSSGRYIHPVTTTTASSSVMGVTITANGTDRLGSNGRTSPSTPDDYKIEYKEIDPIGTNALAIVTRRYLEAGSSDTS